LFIVKPYILKIPANEPSIHAAEDMKFLAMVLAKYRSYCTNKKIS
jgi:hypothetical protein